MFAAEVYRLLEGAADAAFAVTLRGEICFWNNTAEQLFGYSAADVLNRTCDRLHGAGAPGARVCDALALAYGNALLQFARQGQLLRILSLSSATEAEPQMNELEPAPLAGAVCKGHG